MSSSSAMPRGGDRAAAVHVADACRRVEQRGVAHGPRPAARRRSGSAGRSSASRCATRCRGATSTVVGRRPVRAARPPALERQAVLRHPARRRPARRGIARRATVGARSRRTTLHPFLTAEAIGAGQGPDWCAAAMADELRAAGPHDRRRLAGLRRHDARDGRATATSCRSFPGSAALAAKQLALGIDAPTHIEPHVARVTLNPAVLSVARDAARGRDR